MPESMETSFFYLMCHRFFLLKHEAKVLPVSLIKKKVAQVIMKPGRKPIQMGPSPCSSHGQANPFRRATRTHQTCQRHHKQHHRSTLTTHRETDSWLPKRRSHDCYGRSRPGTLLCATGFETCNHAWCNPGHWNIRTPFIPHHQKKKLQQHLAVELWGAAICMSNWAE